MAAPEAMKVAELFAEIGFRIDKRDLKATDRALGGLKRKLVGLAAGVGVVSGVRSILDLGSAANETSNVIQTAFEGQAQAVEDWAQRQAVAMGRSRYELREMAGQLGAMLQPMSGSSEAAADMSTQLAQLAVDLGSFFNTTDQDALVALRAGMVGSMEPLLRYGVVMKQVNLQEYARQQGIRKSIKDMNEAELAQLRFNFILSKTQKAQGDASKTLGGYANQTKAFKAAIKDAATEVGKRVVPVFEELFKTLVPFIRDLTPKILRGIDMLGEKLVYLGKVGQEVVDFVEQYISMLDLLKAAMIGFAAVAVRSAIRTAISWAAAAAPLLLMTAVIIALGIIIEDLWHAFTGGESVLKDLHEEMVNVVVGWIEAVVGFWDWLVGGFKKVAREIKGTLEDALDFLPGVGRSLVSGGGSTKASAIVDDLRAKGLGDQLILRQLEVTGRGDTPEAAELRQGMQPTISPSQVQNTSNTVGSTIGNMVINVTGGGDPRETARKTFDEFARRMSEAQ